MSIASSICWVIVGTFAPTVSHGRRRSASSIWRSVGVVPHSGTSGERLPGCAGSSVTATGTGPPVTAPADSRNVSAPGPISTRPIVAHGEIAMYACDPAAPGT